MQVMRGVPAPAPRLCAIALTAVVLFVMVPGAGAAEPSYELLPVNGFQPLVALDTGASGASVIRLQYALKQQGFYRGPIDGEYGRTTQTAVISFQKYLGLSRTGEFGALDWIRLSLLPDPEVPRRWDEPDRVEVDLTKQIIYIIRDHDVVGVLPTSTGSGEPYFSPHQQRIVRAGTPEGDFELSWHQVGWNCDPVTTWCVYSYWGFTPFYGIHGYNSVPTYPASHGCVRVHTWDSDWLEDQLFVGMPVHVWRQIPDVASPPSPPAFTAL